MYTDGQKAHHVLSKVPSLKGRTDIPYLEDAGLGEGEKLLKACNLMEGRGSIKGRGGKRWGM